MIVTTTIEGVEEEVPFEGYDIAERFPGQFERFVVIQAQPIPLGPDVVAEKSDKVLSKSIRPTNKRNNLFIKNQIICVLVPTLIAAFGGFVWKLIYRPTVLL